MRWRDLPPVEQRPERPERLSQSLLARGNECMRSAYLDMVYNGSAPSHDLIRGTAIHMVHERMLHDLIDRGEATLYAAQPGEDAALAKRHVASLSAAIVEEIRTGHPGLVMPAADWDRVRLMAFHLAIGSTVQPERVCAIEGKYLCEVAGQTVSGKVDVAELDGDTAIVTDLKSTLLLPDQETFEDGFQLKLYALLFCFGVPVVKVPDENGEVVEVERPALGRHVNRVVVRGLYPRYLREDGLVVHREDTLSRTELSDFRVDVEAKVRAFGEAFRSGKWQAVEGSHCDRCPAWSKCPLPPELRGPKPIESEEDAMRSAARWLFLERHKAAEQKRLRAWAAEKGSVPCGRDFVLELSKQEQWDTDWSAVESGVPLDQARKRKTSTRFAKRKLKPGESVSAEAEQAEQEAGDRWGEDAPF